MRRESIERTQKEKLAALLAAVRGSNAFYREKLGAAASDASRALKLSALKDPPLEEILEGIPFTTKEELLEDQRRHPPFGSNLTFPLERYTRIHQTSGTSGEALWWLDTPESWGWVVRTWDEVFGAARVVAEDRVFFPFSFGPFLGFWAAFEGAARRGHLAIPGGGMSTSARLRVLLHTGATVVAATPTYALRMAEAAQAEGVDLASSSVRALIVAGEPGGSVPATKERIETAWGARCFDHSGMTEVGPFGFECLEGPGGMHVMEAEYIVEVIDPRTGKKIVPGSKGPAEGELVITNLGRAASPVLRYRTGDLVRWSLGGCTCGRAEGRLEGGILGRIDDMIFVRGNNLYPSAIEAIIRKFPEVAEYRVRAFSSNEMTRLEIEVEAVPAGAEGKADLPARVASAIEKALLFKANVKLVIAGSLPRFEMKGKRFHKETV